MYRGVNCLFSKQCRIACRLRVADSLHGHRAMPCTSTSTWLNCNYDATWHSPLTADSSGNTTQLGFNAGLVNKREPAGGILPIALAQAEQYSVTESESMGGGHPDPSTSRCPSSTAYTNPTFISLHSHQPTTVELLHYSAFDPG